MAKQIHINPAMQTTYAADHANTTYILDKGAVFDPVGNGVTATYSVEGRDFVIRGTLKGDNALNIGDYYTHDGGGDLKVTASGSILGKDTGVSTYGNYQTIENAGHIGGGTLGAVFMQGRHSHLLNTGDVTSDKTGVVLTGNSSTLENHGKIVTTDDAVRLDADDNTLINATLISSDHFGATLAGDHSKIINHGSIIGSTAGIYIYSNGDDEQHFVRNDDHITGPHAIWGSSDRDVIRNSGSLSGIVDLGGGDDVFNGRGGESPDGIHGGDGDDLYIISKPMTLVEESGAGNDKVKVSVSFTLPANFEELHLTGKANASATGNSGFNFLYGNSGNNVIDAAGGGDSMFGGAGADTFIFKNGYGQLSVLDAQLGGKNHDILDFSGTSLHSFADVMSHVINGESGIQIQYNDNERVYLDHVHKGNLHAGDFSF